MIPILFEYNTTSFTTHGIGDLIDCTNCYVVMNAEGEYELSFSYPSTGEYLNELTIGRLIYVKANPWQSNQIFRIYGYQKGIGESITVNCQHISYDLANIPVKNFKSASSATANTVLANMKTNAVSITGLNVNSFTFYSNVQGTAQTQTGYFEVGSPSTVRSVILDGEDSIKGCFGGDLVFDNYNVYLYATAGADRGVKIEYGVDLMDIQQEENISEMYTGILPYYTYTDANDVDRVTYGSAQYATGTFRSHRVLPMSFNEYFPNQAEHTSPTAAQLNAKAQEWIRKEDEFGKPEINLTLKYAELGQDIRLHDAVTVNFVKMGINNMKSKVVSVKYDVLRERITEVQVGKTKQSVIFSLEDASRLRKGLLPPARIRDKSLTSSKYADNSVTTAAIGSNAVTTDKLIKDAVTSDKINSGAVTNPKLSSNSVAAGNIQDGAVIKRTIDDYAVDDSKLASNAVTEDKIAGNAVTNGKIAENAVQNKQIAKDAVTDDSIKNGSVTVNKIQNGAVVEDKIATDAVTENKILNAAVKYAKLAGGSVDDDKFTLAMQVTWTDILAAEAVFAGFIYSEGVIQCQSVVCQGVQYMTRYVTIDGTTFRVLGEAIG